MAARMLEGKVAIITGSTSGIGLAIAQEFLRQGASVTLTGRNPKVLNEAGQKCIQLCGNKDKIFLVQGDVTNEESRVKLINDTVKHFGKLDILVNNAGSYQGNSLSSDFDLTRLDNMISLHTKAPFHLIKLAIPHLIKTKGNIVNTSSLASIKPPAITWVEYGMAKAAVDHLTRFAALELGPKGVRANSINPAAIETNLLAKEGMPAEEYSKAFEQWHALKRSGKPEEIGKVAAFLASDAASFITGLVMPVDGGCLLVPPGSV
uniref:L-xylulose reductase n=1 Tax=Scolopendra viridis TaxID=118503 RepID=A0A4D5R9Q0_SCOVI